ncbi:MAG: hypothetical protein RL653_1544 [Pseudomonadota bacterium]|jgi:hypothetical protein
MAFLRSFLWSLCCVGFGIFLASVEVGGRTPLEHGRRAWRRTVNPTPLEKIQDHLDDAFGSAKNGLEDAKEAVKDRVASKDRPREHVSTADRAGLNSLIARKAEKK